jgi:hypothetical protein
MEQENRRHEKFWNISALGISLDSSLNHIPQPLPSTLPTIDGQTLGTTAVGLGNALENGRLNLGLERQD